LSAKRVDAEFKSSHCRPPGVNVRRRQRSFQPKRLNQRAFTIKVVPKIWTWWNIGQFTWGDRMAESVEAQLHATLKPDSGVHLVRDSVRRAHLPQRASCGLRWAPKRPSPSAWNGHVRSVDSHIAFLHPEDQEETRRVWSECLRTGRPSEVSFRARSAEGGFRWFLSRAEPFRANDGTILYWIGSTSTSKNVSKRKSSSAGTKNTWQTRRDSAAPASLQWMEHQTVVLVRGSRSDLRIPSGTEPNA